MCLNGYITKQNQELARLKCEPSDAVLKSAKKAVTTYELFCTLSLSP